MGKQISRNVRVSNLINGALCAIKAFTEARQELTSTNGLIPFTSLLLIEHQIYIKRGFGPFFVENK